ncbi:MAG: hypothetical protein WBA61_10630 [Aequorivita sp.]
MNNLTTIRGFYETFLQLLPQYETQTECFEFLNAEVQKINGRKMFFNLRDFQIRTIGKGLETIPDFCRTYFDLLPYFKSSKECFEYIHGISITRAEIALFSDYRDFKGRTWGA